MGEVKVFTDSTCDLTRDIINTYDISVVPLYVGFDNGTYRDGVDITAGDLFKMVDECGKLPKTAAPSPNDFYNEFKPFVEQGKDIVYIGLSSSLSSTLQNAIIAANEFPEGRVEIVDSMNLSTGIGILVLKACDFAKAGMNAHEIAREIQMRVPKVKTAFVIDTLDYLYMGGRCSSLQNFMSGVFKIKPIVKVVDGKMILGEKARGKMERALNVMLDNVLVDKYNIDWDRIIVTHSVGNTDSDYLKGKLEENMKVKEVIITAAGCVISSHCGPNTIGIIYLGK
ncbi:MAG: fatty acid-binding protein DegV [Clostridiales bacterium]|nr:fatty acid-binding protein DegV [Clostridiales bacterium]